MRSQALRDLEDHRGHEEGAHLSLKRQLRVDGSKFYEIHLRRSRRCASWTSGPARVAQQLHSGCREGTEPDDAFLFRSDPGHVRSDRGSRSSVTSNLDGTFRLSGIELRTLYMRARPC